MWIFHGSKVLRRRRAVQGGCKGRARDGQPVSRRSGRGAWAKRRWGWRQAVPGVACTGNRHPLRQCWAGRARLVAGLLPRDPRPGWKGLRTRMRAAFFAGATDGPGRRVAHRMSGSAVPPGGWEAAPDMAESDRSPQQSPGWRKRRAGSCCGRARCDDADAACHRSGLCTLLTKLQTWC